MTQFINIHALISHSSSLLNRDDAGMQKTAIFGGSTRSRISSQCLKRAIRTSEMYLKDTQEVSIRTNKFDELLAMAVTELSDFDPKKIEQVLLNLGSKIKSEKSKESGQKERFFDAVQPYSIGAIRESLLLVDAGLELKDLSKNVLLPTDDVALSGRMDASCVARNVEAAMSVAHSFTTHTSDIEVDWFTACDDLSEQGSGHIGATEFSSGVFYRYASINVDLLAKNTGKSLEEVQPLVDLIVRCFAQVTPSAKQKTFAAHNLAEFVMVTQADQPLSLANAFRTPVSNNGLVMQNSIAQLVSHYDILVEGFDLVSKAKAFDMTKTLNSSHINAVSSIKLLLDE